MEIVQQQGNGDSENAERDVCDLIRVRSVVYLLAFYRLHNLTDSCEWIKISEADVEADSKACFAGSGNPKTHKATIFSIDSVRILNGERKYDRARIQYETVKQGVGVLTISSFSVLISSRISVLIIK